MNMARPSSTAAVPLLTSSPSTARAMSEKHPTDYYAESARDGVSSLISPVPVDRVATEDDVSQNPPDRSSPSSAPMHATQLKSALESSVREVGETDRRRLSSITPTIGPKVYKPTVAVMILALLVGIGSAAALDGYYGSLDGSVVGSPDDQQRALRIGTALAFFAQVGFVYSIHKAYVQWLWKELKSHVVSFRGIDAAFTATSDPLAFVNTEMLRKLKFASSIAFVGWFIPISSFIAPATLNVNPVLRNATHRMDTPVLNIAQASAYVNFSYAVNGTTPQSQKYLGPRTVITRLAVATATTGQILTFPPPATNASYEQVFFGPYVQCENSTSEVQDQMQGMITRYNQSLGGSIELKALDYFAAVPALESAGAGDVPITNFSDVDATTHASNQLWIYFTSYEPSLDFSQPVTSHYLTCQLYNASYTTRFTWTNGAQRLEILDHTLLEPVPYPTNASRDASSEEAMAYSAVMWAVSKPLTGSMAFIRDVAAQDATLAGNVYSDIATELAQTVLIGSADFNSHFMENHLLGLGPSMAPNSVFSSQRLLDMAHAHNASLAALIGQLSANVTLSLFTNPLLAPPAPTDVAVAALVNIYVFQRRNVLLAYGLAGGVALLANVLGLAAFYAAGESHDNAFSSITCATRDVHYSALRVRAHERLGALPLDGHVADTLLQFHSGANGRYGFGTVDEESA